MRTYLERLCDFISHVGSRTGAHTLGSGGLSTTFAMGLSPAPIATFPAPASSNRACRFPAHGSPARFAPRVMGPIELGALSTVAHNLGPYNCHRDPIPHRATAYSTSSSRSPLAFVLASGAAESSSPPSPERTRSTGSSDP